MAVAEIWSDLHYSLTTDAQGAVRKAANVDAVIVSIDNILRTDYGERVMLPQFGSNLGYLLFEATSQELFDNAAEELQAAIRAWDDRVTISSVESIVHPDRNQVLLKVSFTIKGYDHIFEYNTNLSGG